MDGKRRRAIDDRPEAGLLRLLAGLDRLEVAYMIAGSAASSTHGLWRATADVDLVVSLDRDRADEFVAEFQGEFYLDRDHILQSLALGRGFNLIHLGSAYKFDLFPLGPERFQRRQFARRRYEKASIFGGAAIELSVATPEDVILSKLSRYRRGGEVSDRQWTDVLGVVAQQRSRLDIAYLNEWANELGIADLLEAALRERHGA